MLNDNAVVIDVQDSYSLWNENPQEMIEKCSTTESPFLLQQTSLQQNYVYSVYNMTQIQLVPSYLYMPPCLNITPGIYQMTAIPHTFPITQRNSILPTPNHYQLTTSYIPQQTHHQEQQQEQVDMLDNSMLDNSMYGCPRKYTPEQLVAIQERVRDSLYRQGVVSNI